MDWHYFLSGALFGAVFAFGFEVGRFFGCRSERRKLMVRMVFALLLLTLAAPSANAQANCWWDGRGMHCREGYTWQERREWRDHEWRERERARRHWEWEHSGRW
jgi:hypothetical protein